MTRRVPLPWIAGVVLVGLIGVGCAGEADRPAARPGSDARVTPRSRPAPSADPGHPAFEHPIVAVHVIEYGPGVLAPGYGFVWVEGHRSNDLSRIDPRTGATSRVAADVHCDVGIGGDAVWTTIARRDLVSKVDPRTSLVVDQWEVPDACGIVASDRDVWVIAPSSARLYRIDPASGDVAGVGSLDRGMVDGVVAFGSLWLWSEARGGALSRIDPSSGGATSRTPLDDIDAVAAGAGSLWAVGRGTDRLYRIGPSGDVIASTKLPGRAGGVAVAFGSVWVAGLDTGTLYRLEIGSGHVGAVPLRFEGAAIDIGAEASTRAPRLGPIAAGYGRLWISVMDENVVLEVDPRLASSAR